MEAQSLLVDEPGIIDEKDIKFRYAQSVLNGLLSPHSQDPNLMLKWIDENIIGNPIFDQIRAARFRSRVADFYEECAVSVPGEDQVMTMAEAFQHPGLKAKKDKIEAIFSDIGPIIRATRGTIATLISQ